MIKAENNVNYRPEVDGLRAVAVLPVILFHGGFEVFGGGFIGVDVFFVISGYLITNILLSEIERGQFSLIGFYERRARRILPALFFVLVCCLPFAWLWMMPSQLEDFGRGLISVTLFVSNFLFAQDVGYFAPLAEQRPLLHTWSLAVEEQFYIVFPIVLFLFSRFGRKPAFGIIATAFFVGFLSVAFNWESEPSARFFSTSTRAWELLAGSMCAFAGTGRWSRTSELAAAIGLGLILFAIFFFDQETPFPSAWTLFPVLGTALIIMFGVNGTLVARLLSQHVCVSIGLISYSAYLWHQPLFAFARIRDVSQVHWFVMLALAAASLALAAFSWRYVEQPFRRRRTGRILSRNKLFVASGFVAACLVGLGTSALLAQGYQERYPSILALDYSLDNAALRRASWQPLREISGNQRYRVKHNAFDNTTWLMKEEGKSTLLIAGDSHSKDLFNILSYSQSARSRFNIARYGIDIRNFTPDHPLLSSPNYLAADYVMVAARYTEDFVEPLSKFLNRVQSDGKKPILVLRTPTFDGTVSRTLVDAFVLQSEARTRESLPDDFLNRVAKAHWKSWQTRSEIHEINEELIEFARMHSIAVLNREDFTCSADLGICHALSENLVKYFYDGAHVTISGAKFFGSMIDKVDWLSTTAPQSGEPLHAGRE